MALSALRRGAAALVTLHGARAQQVDWRAAGLILLQHAHGGGSCACASLARTSTDTAVATAEAAAAAVLPVPPTAAPAARRGRPCSRGFAAEAGPQPPADVAAELDPSSYGPPDLRVPLLNWARESVGTAVLPGPVFNAKVRRDVLHRVVRWQLARRQQGTHKTKGRSEVRGGGRKPWQQKGSGKARAGTIRAPHWRGGGIAHGPVVRSHEHDLQRKVRRQGLACALSAKASEGRLLVMESLELPEGKTRVLDERLDELLADAPRRSVLMIDSGKAASDGGLPLRRAAANMPWVDVLPQEGANVYSILQRDILVMTHEAALAVAARTMEPVHRTPARLRKDPVPEPMLHPLIRAKLAVAVEAANAARLRGVAEGKLAQLG